MALYENVFVVRQDVSAQQVEELTARFTDMITEAGGRVAKTEYWGLITLAYKIKKNRKGHYVLLNVDAPSAALQEVERNMGLSEDVIRFLTVRVDELEEGPSAVMRNKGSRGDRGDRGNRGDRGDRDRGDRRGPRGGGDSGDRVPRDRSSETASASGGASKDESSASSAAPEAPATTEEASKPPTEGAGQ